MHGVCNKLKDRPDGVTQDWFDVCYSSESHWTGRDQQECRKQGEFVELFLQLAALERGKGKAAVWLKAIFKGISEE